MKVMRWGDLCCDNQIDQKWLKWMNWWVVWNGIVKHFDKVIWNNIIMSFEKQNSLFLCLREFTHFPFYSTSHSVLLWRNRWKSTLDLKWKTHKKQPKKDFSRKCFCWFSFHLSPMLNTPHTKNENSNNIHILKDKNYV